MSPRLHLIQGPVNFAGVAGLWLPAGYTMPTYAAPIRTFYVDLNAGSDANTVTQAQNPATPWRTITRANQNAIAGDHVLFRGSASYAYGSGPKPTANGTAANKIVYKQWPGQAQCVMTSTDATFGFEIDGKQHLVFDGLEFRSSNSSAYINQMWNGAGNIWMLRCTVRDTPVSLNACADSKFYENTFIDVGDFAGNEGDGIVWTNGSNRIEVVGNTCFDCGHAGISADIYSQIGGGADNEDGWIAYNRVRNTKSGGINLSGNTLRAIVEHNDIWDSATNPVGSPGSSQGILIRGRDCIIRRNRIWNCAGDGIQGISQLFSGFQHTVMRQQVYHNTIWGCGGRPLRLQVSNGNANTLCADNVFTNNLCWENHQEGATEGGGFIDGNYMMIWLDAYLASTGWDATLGGNVFQGNRCGRNTGSPTGDRFALVATPGGSGNAYLTLAQFQSTYPASSGNAHSGADPLFVSEVTPDFHLQAGSPCINAGVVISGQSYLGTAPDVGAYERE
jgi:hypothetical protein